MEFSLIISFELELWQVEVGTEGRLVIVKPSWPFKLLSYTWSKRKYLAYQEAKRLNIP